MANVVHNKLVLRRAEQLSFNFLTGKSVMLHHSDGPGQGHFTERIDREGEKRDSNSQSFG